MDRYTILVSPLLPMPPSVGENARRMVRHGMKDVLKWLGEDVGPAPGIPVTGFVHGDILYVSQSLYDKMHPNTTVVS